MSEVLGASEVLGEQATYEAIGHGVVARVVDRDVVIVRGPDALSYVQGQATQDISALRIGESAESLLLSPQGKFEAYVRIALVSPDEIVVESDAGRGSEVFDRLKRFKLRIKAELVAASWQALEVRGPTAVLPEVVPDGASYIAPVNWPGLSGYDVIGENVILPAGLALGEDGAFEAARIEAGIPIAGAELSDKTIPQEAGLVERTVSFTKGCYTGQELVARLDARGNNVARRLRALRFAKDADVTAGSELVIADKVVGAVTSVAYSPGKDALVGLGYLRRDVVLPHAVLAGGAEGHATELA